MKANGPQLFDGQPSREELHTAGRRRRKMTLTYRATAAEQEEDEKSRERRFLEESCYMLKKFRDESSAAPSFTIDDFRGQRQQRCMDVASATSLIADRPHRKNMATSTPAHKKSLSSAR